MKGLTIKSMVALDGGWLIPKPQGLNFTYFGHLFGNLE
jgi:hypothetical protein